MKKKFVIILLILSIFMIDSSVSALNIFGKTDELRDVCGVSLSSSVPLFTSGIYNLIKILVPIILIIMGMIDFSKAVMAQDEKKMNDATKTFIRRIIAAIFVFFIMAIVQFIFNKVSSNSGFSSCMNCVLSNDCTISTENYKSDSSKYNNYKDRSLPIATFHEEVSSAVENAIESAVDTAQSAISSSQSSNNTSTTASTTQNSKTCLNKCEKVPTSEKAACKKSCNNKKKDTCSQCQNIKDTTTKAACLKSCKS